MGKLRGVKRVMFFAFAAGLNYHVHVALAGLSIVRDGAVCVAGISGFLVLKHTENGLV